VTSPGPAGSPEGRIRIAVVFGGRSAEHEVSVISAASVLSALDPERFDVVTIGIDKAGGWHLLSALPSASGQGRTLPAVAAEEGTAVTLSREPGQHALVAADGSRAPVDVVFPVLHGPFGEDGTLQGMLELAGVPYVGAGVLASALGMDKAVQKVLFRDAGLPVVPHEVVREGQWEDDRESVEARAEALGMPLFVKPASLGSSVGITKVKTLDQLADAMAEAFRFDVKVVIERGVEGAREIECAVLGNDDPVASLPGEIVPGAEFYDYAAKYLDGGTVLKIPADLPDEVVAEVQRMAVAAFRAIDGSGMARVDFFYREGEGRDAFELVVNEINTIPGFTAVSMFPQMWEASGLTYRELVDRLVELALERHHRERRPGSPP
jgi:D-alanine-D-alanine ligase